MQTVRLVEVVRRLGSFGRCDGGHLGHGWPSFAAVSAGRVAALCFAPGPRRLVDLILVREPRTTTVRAGTTSATRQSWNTKWRIVTASGLMDRPLIKQASAARHKPRPIPPTATTSPTTLQRLTTPLKPWGAIASIRTMSFSEACCAAVRPDAAARVVPKCMTDVITRPQSFGVHRGPPAARTHQ